METTRKVNVPQFFLALFVAQATTALAFNAQYAGGPLFLDNLLSCLLALGLGLQLALPSWGLLRRWGEGVLPLQGRDWAEKAAAALWLLYFVWENGASLTLFQIFLLDTVDPEFSAGLVTAVLLGTGLYGALRGIEAVARCAFCVFFVFLLGCGGVFAVAALRFSPQNLSPLFYNGPSQALEGAALLLSRSTSLAALPLLLPFVTGKKARGFALQSLGCALFFGAALTLVAGCLGALRRLSELPPVHPGLPHQIHSLQRLDTVFIGVWIAGLVIRAPWSSTPAGCAPGPCWVPAGTKREPPWRRLCPGGWPCWECGAPGSARRFCPPGPCCAPPWERDAWCPGCCGPGRRTGRERGPAHEAPALSSFRAAPVPAPRRLRLPGAPGQAADSRHRGGCRGGRGLFRHRPLRRQPGGGVLPDPGGVRAGGPDRPVPVHRAGRLLRPQLPGGLRLGLRPSRPGSLPGLLRPVL